MTEEMQAHFDKQLRHIQDKKTEVIKAGKFEEAVQVRKEERNLMAEIEQLKAHGLRYNDGKLKWSYVHFGSLEPMVRVLMFGAQKYEPFNWQKGLKKDEILESMQRHLAKLIDGEINDPESGLPHIGHIQCNAMFYQYMVMKELEALKKRTGD